MDKTRVYANLKPSRTPGPKHASPPSFPSDACWCPRWHQWALKFCCAILLLFGFIGFSVLVRFLIQKCSVDVQANTTEATGRPALSQCSRDWHSHHDKCLYFFPASRPWSEGLSDCSAKEATLLLVQDQEELMFIQDFTKTKGQSFWIGLNYISSEKIWKWINGSIVKVKGENEQDSCAVVSQDKVVSDICSSDNHWICQKKLKPV
uniref:C-type lectin domain-containing protein n=1 Tax=Nannospalax galili TaxID=1026970 RepID=A0A8C6RNP4_NANGA